MKKIIMILLVVFSSLFIVISKEENLSTICWEDCRLNGVYEEDIIQKYLLDNIPEIHDYAKYIEKKSDGKACLSIQIYEIVEVTIDDSMNIIKCYPVYVGEKWDNYSVNWDWFYVNENVDMIYWYDIIEGEFYSLEDWRKGDWYRDL